MLFVTRHEIFDGGRKECITVNTLYIVHPFADRWTVAKEERKEESIEKERKEGRITVKYTLCIPLQVGGPSQRKKGRKKRTVEKRKGRITVNIRLHCASLCR